MINFMDFYYTGPGTLAGRYMRKFWHPVYRAEDLKPGWSKPIRIMSEEFTLYRGEGGKPHVVAFRCPHRLSVSRGGLRVAFVAVFTAGSLTVRDNA
jgi:5,5'-dehydrodivanillate O-demethylase